MSNVNVGTRPDRDFSSHGGEQSRLFDLYHTKISFQVAQETTYILVFNSEHLNETFRRSI